MDQHTIAVSNNATDEPLWSFLDEATRRAELSNEQLAQALGTRPTAWELIRTGKLKLAFDKIESAADILGIAPKDLLRRFMIDAYPTAIEMIERHFSNCEFTTVEKQLIIDLRKLAPERSSVTLTRTTGAWSIGSVS